MKTNIVKLFFKGSVHFGDGRLSGGVCSCDAGTLFSALYMEALREGVADGFLEAARTGELSMSDAFPFIDDTLYIPKPMMRLSGEAASREKLEEEGDSRVRKASKKLEYIPSERLGGYLSGDFDAIDELGRFEIGSKTLATKVSLHQRELGEDAKPYHVGGFSFAENAGLYFVLKGDALEFAVLLEQLSYSGLGGKRSSGYGRFTFRVDECKLPICDSFEPCGSGRRFMLLSTCTPSPSELTDDLLAGARYRLVRKGGFVQSSAYSESFQKKRDMYLFAAGSVFEQRFAGDVFDVSDAHGSHPVYRYARAMWMEV